MLADARVFSAIAPALASFLRGISQIVAELSAGRVIDALYRRLSMVGEIGEPAEVVEVASFVSFASDENIIGACARVSAARD